MPWIVTRALVALKNIGPVTARQLKAVGIASEPELRAVGALDAYRRLKAAFPREITLVCLYVLQGALFDCHWNDLPPGVREQLQATARERENR